MLTSFFKNISFFFQFCFSLFCLRLINSATRDLFFVDLQETPKVAFKMNREHQLGYAGFLKTGTGTSLEPRYETETIR